MDTAVKWALSFVDTLPAVPASNLLALFVIVIAVTGLIRKAWRTSPLELPEAQPVVMLNASSVYTILTNIEMAVQRVERRQETIEQITRRRHKPVGRRKKKKVPPAEPV